MKHENTLTTLQARSIIAIVNRFTFPCNSVDYRTIEDYSIDLLDLLFNDVHSIFDKNDKVLYYSALSFCQSLLAKKAYKEKIITLQCFFHMLAQEKKYNETALNDYGAFGDLYEILIRCAFLPNFNLIKYMHLSVHELDSYDIYSKKYGRIECGHNGKTLASGTVFDYMEGDYKAIIYGVFDETTKTYIYNACMNGQIDKAIQAVKEYSVLWTDKYQFEKDINNLTRGKGITIKSGKVMVQFNAGKYNAFVNAIENGIFTPLSDILK